MSLGNEMSKRSMTHSKKINNNKQVPLVTTKDPTVPKGAWYSPAWVWGDGPTGARAQRPLCVPGKQAVSGRAGAMGQAERVGVFLVTPQYKDGDTRGCAWDQWDKWGSPGTAPGVFAIPSRPSSSSLCLPPHQLWGWRGQHGGYPWVQPCPSHQPANPCARRRAAATCAGGQGVGSLCLLLFAGLW